MNRQGATCKGLERRLNDAGFEKVHEPRQMGKVTNPLPNLLNAMAGSMVTKAQSLRAVEQRTAQMVRKHGTWMGVDKRIADNTFGKVLPRLRLSDLVACLHRLIKAEHRRGNLEATWLPAGTVAIDGKNVATLRWHDLCRVLELKQTEATPEQVKSLCAERYPDAQVCIPKQDQPYALMRMHTVTLISSDAPVCIHQRPTLGHTNEIGSMPALLDELKAAYGRTRLFELVTTDAGNTSLAVAGQVINQGCHYFAQIKSGQGEIHAEAVRALRQRRKVRAHASYSEMQNGQMVTYHCWCHDLSTQGWLDWTHGRQVVRVQRTAEDPSTGKRTAGNRFYVTSKTPPTLGPDSALKISRAHWRCENNTHWTADAELMEDRRRLAWSRHPNGVFIVSVLRMISLVILAMVRSLSRFGYTKETPSWAQVSEHFLLQLCGSILETEAFDTV